MRYTVSDGHTGQVLSEHRTPRAALLAARKLALPKELMIVSEYPDRTAKTGRAIAHVTRYQVTEL